MFITYSRCGECGKKKHVKNLKNYNEVLADHNRPLCPACAGTEAGEAISTFFRELAGRNRCSNCGNTGDNAGSNNAYLAGREVIHGVCDECKSHLEDQSLRDFAKRIIGDLCEEMNGGDHTRVAAALADAIETEHRYLQGELFSMLFEFFALYSKHDYDARNEWAVKIAGVWERAVGRGDGQKDCPTCGKVFRGEQD